MNGNDFYTFMRTFVPLHFGPNLVCKVEMTTKKNSKSVNHNDEDYSNKYTMFLVNTKTGAATHRSDEIKGSNKANWTAQEYGRFVGTLKKIEE